MFGFGKSAKIQQQSKKWQLLFILVVIILALGLKLYSHYWPKAEILIGGQNVKVLVADTVGHRYKGWGNKKDMGKYGGMLFVFDAVGDHAMVMRNMNFSLDIVWIKSFKIVDMAPNLPPEKGVPEDKLTVYRARLPADMVLELPTGFITQNTLRIGDAVQVIKK